MPERQRRDKALRYVMRNFDNPENSETVSKPLAHPYGLCLLNNRSEVDRYFEWGAKRAEFLPLEYRLEDADPTLTLDCRSPTGGRLETRSTGLGAQRRVRSPVVRAFEPFLPIGIESAAMPQD